MPRVRIEVGAQLSVLSDELGEVTPRLRRSLRERQRRLGQRVASRARANASWSRRIPGAIQVTTTATAGGPIGFSVGVDRGKAPHGGLLEGGRKRSFRHPVFKRVGKKNPWVSQPTRPFLRPAWEAEKDSVFEETEKAIADATSRLR